MKQIIFITNELSGGGAERVMSVLANYLCKEGYKVKFIILQRMNQEYPLDDSVEKILWQEKKTGDFIGQIKFIRKNMKDNKGATFVSFFTHQNLYAIIASFGLNVKVVVSERNDPEYSINGSLKKTLRKILYASSLCDKVVFQTNGAKEYFGKKIQNKGVIIANPLKDGLPKSYFGNREKSVVSFGRFEPQKNYALLLKAFSCFSRDNTDYVLKLYGQGTLENELKDLAKTLGIKDKVYFMGFDKNVHEKIVKEGIFVLPSNYEGLSNSMLEAMALGLPVICTDCPPGGAREYIENGINGILVPVNNEEKMVEALFDLAKDSDKAALLGKNASMLRDKLDSNIICAKWEAQLR